MGFAQRAGNGVRSPDNKPTVHRVPRTGQSARRALPTARPMAERPRVSVLMPAFNAERFLARAVDSVLAQTHEDLELVVVDDGSKDRTFELLQEYARKDRR